MRGKNKEVFKEGTEREERGAVEGGSWMPFVKVSLTLFVMIAENVRGSGTQCGS